MPQTDRGGTGLATTACRCDRVPSRSRGKARGPGPGLARAARARRSQSERRPAVTRGVTGGLALGAATDQRPSHRAQIVFDVPRAALPDASIDADGDVAPPSLFRPAIGHDFDGVRDVGELSLQEIDEVRAPRGNDEQESFARRH